MSTTYPDLSLTVFPDGGIDTFTTWLNVTAQDGPLIQQYITAMNAGNQAQANQILSQISSGSQKIIKATDLNKLTQAILAVERFYSVDIKPYVQNKQEEWLNIINQFSYVGAWSNGTAYVQNNIVSYIVSGITLLFIATSNPPTGTVPTNTQYWRPLSVQGTPGESGPGLSYRQEWNSSTSYSVNDCVTYSGAVWMALQANKNIIPGQDPSYWKNIISFGAVAYPIQDTEPTGQAAGGLWFNTQDNPTNYVYLEPLNNPAGAEEIVNGYEAYNDNGELVTGTANYLPITGGTMTGPITLAADPAADMQAVTKQYVDEKAGNLPQGLENAVLLDEVPITLPSSASWYSVTYGNGKFVAVAYSSNKAAYSSDGINWVAATLPSPVNWYSVTYGNGKFVAVSGNNSDKAAYSSDGINWVAATLPSSANWRFVTYGNGKFVAVANSGNKAAYSSDGINWTAATLPSPVNWYSVTYGNGKFVAVSGNNSDKAAYSSDGINWVAATLPSPANWYSVTYGNGKFVAVSDNNSDKAAYSSDGINWVAATLPSSANWRFVTYGNGKFVAVAYSSNKAAYSSDGINWTSSTLPSPANWYSVTYGNGKFVAVSGRNSDKAAYSSDGINWHDGIPVLVNPAGEDVTALVKQALGVA